MIASAPIDLLQDGKYKVRFMDYETVIHIRGGALTLKQYSMLRAKFLQRLTADRRPFRGFALDSLGFERQ